MAESKKIQVSIISAVDDVLDDLAGWFNALNSQTLSNESYEVILVDSSHDTGHQAAFNQFREEGWLGHHVGYYRTDPGGRAVALNRGLDLARSDLIVFLGDDCLPPLDFAESHLRFHQLNTAPEAVAVGPALFPPDLRTPFSDWLERTGRLFGVPFDPHTTSVSEDFFYVANASVKRELLDRAGRFDEQFRHHVMDDFELGQRLRSAGMKAEFLPEATVVHLHRIDLTERERAIRLAGTAARVYALAHPEAYRWSNSMNFPAALHQLRNALTYVGMRVRKNDSARIRWWHARLAAAFAEGYRNSAVRSRR